MIATTVTTSPPFAASYARLLLRRCQRLLLHSQSSAVLATINFAHSLSLSVTVTSSARSPMSSPLPSNCSFCPLLPILYHHAHCPLCLPTTVHLASPGSVLLPTTSPLTPPPMSISLRFTDRVVCDLDPVTSPIPSDCIRLLLLSAGVACSLSTDSKSDRPLHRLSHWRPPPPLLRLHCISQQILESEERRQGDLCHQ